MLFNGQYTGRGWSRCRTSRGSSNSRKYRAATWRQTETVDAFFPPAIIASTAPAAVDSLEESLVSLLSTETKSWQQRALVPALLGLVVIVGLVSFGFVIWQWRLEEAARG